MKPTKQKSRRAEQLGALINRHGGNYGLRLAMEAEAQNVPISVVCAVCEQETGFRNLFGHDRNKKGNISGIPAKWAGTVVTRAKYWSYKFLRGTRGQQGVGPFQLTFKGFQDEADKDGGAWNPDVNIATGVRILATMFKNLHEWEIVYAVWNAGSQTAAGRAYAESVKKKQTKWHVILT
jgi:hypothetical protein